MSTSDLLNNLVSIDLLNQSAYCKHHSTETALLYIYDYLINATGSQKLSCLCLFLISSLSLNRHLYSTFFLFHPETLTHVLPTCQVLQNTRQQISSWMLANLLSLNSSKTEFLDIRLKKQLSKIVNSSLSTTHSACYLSTMWVCDQTE